MDDSPQNVRWLPQNSATTAPFNLSKKGQIPLMVNLENIISDG